MTALRVLAVATVLFAGGVVDLRRVSDGRVGGSFEASLTRFGDGFAAAWYDTRDGVPSIYMRLLAADGTPIGPERRLTRERTAYEPDIAVLGSTLVVSWYEYDEKSGFRAMVAGYAADGRRRWLSRLSPADCLGRNAIVRSDGVRLAVAWISECAGARDAQVQWLDAKGKRARGGGADVYRPVSATTWSLNAAIDSVKEPASVHEDLWLAWDAAHPKSGVSEVFLGRPSSSSPLSSVTLLTRDDGVPSKYPDLAFGEDGTMAVTWFDQRDGNEEVYLAVGPRSELQSGVEGRARRVTTNSGNSIGAYLAWNGDRLGLAWCDNSSGQHEIYFQAFDRTGTPLGDARQITQTSADSLIPSIRPFGDGFALLWNEFIAGPGGGHDPRSRSDVMFAHVPADR